MTKTKTYKEIKADLLEQGFEEKPFSGVYIHGFYFQKHFERKDSHEFKVFPFFGNEYLGLRLDWEITDEGLKDNPNNVDIDAHLIKLFEGALVNDILDIAGNVCEKMTNKDVFAPIIPKEAYDK